MPIEYVTVSFEPGEFEAKFPKIAAREDLTKSDKVRVALKLKPGKVKRGGQRGNKNAVGNKGRWPQPEELK